MATPKTGSFYLTESVQLNALQGSGVASTATIDLSAYVNVPTGQAIAITEVDFIWQRAGAFGQDAQSLLGGNGALCAQLTDLNPGTAMVRADDQSLVASGALNIDQTNNIASHQVDIYPDNFGPNSLSEAFIVVNDQLYLTGMPSGTAVGADNVFLTARIRSQVVKLSTKDWMAVAIQATAADN